MRIFLFFIFLICKTTFYSQQGGDIDTSFDTGTGFNDNVKAIAIQSDGKIIVGGDFTTYKGISKNRIVRLNIDGSIDTSFNSGTGFNNSVNCITIQSDGKILLGGRFNSFNGNGTDPLIRLNSNGSIDTDFRLIDRPYNGDVNSIALKSDGKIVFGGSFMYGWFPRFYILHPDGMTDTSYSPLNGASFNYEVNTIVMQSDGKMMVGGNFSSYEGSSQWGIVRLNSNGRTDTTFNSGSGFNTEVFSISIQNDGKILAGGDFTSYRGIQKKYLTRINTDGSIDSSFNSGLPGSTGFVYGIVIQPDGKIIVASEFKISRLNTDGSLDTTLNTGTVSHGGVAYCLALQNDGKIIVGGSLYSYRGTTINKIMRIHGNNVLSNSDFTSNETISLFPNPVLDYLNFVLPNNPTIENIEIFDLQGKQLTNFTFEKNKINVNALNSGFYIVNIKSNGQTYAKKIIKN